MEITIQTNNNLNSSDAINELEEEDQEVSFIGMFRFATKGDVTLMVIGFVCSALMGIFIPIFALLTGNMIDSFGTTDIFQQAKKNLFNYLYLGAGALIVGPIMFSTWMIAGERQGAWCRREYFRSLLTQQVGWFDCQNQAGISTTFQLDSLTFQQAVGEKISTLIMVVAMFLSGLGVSFYLGWIMSLVLLAYIPLIMIAWTKNFVVNTQTAKIDDQVYRNSDSKLQQSITAIKLVKQMNAQEFQVGLQAEIQQQIKDAYQSSMLRHVIFSFIAVISLYLLFVLAYWYGSQCILDTEKCPQSISSRPYTAGSLVKILYSLLMPALSLNQLSPCIQKIVQGKAAAARIFKIIDRVPKIKSKPEAIQPENFIGVFEFRRVTFSYPKQKNKKILDNLNLKFDCKHTAIVGASGCGKSTIFQLMMRFYDPDQGTVTLDGIDLRDLNLDWLRSQISYVTQQPILFATSIYQNLLLGKADASVPQIQEALKKAEAYTFVYEFNDRLETFVGSGGSQLSGGQKQRIAIARSLLKNPKLLLMDEATSALDRKNEYEILKTLKKVGAQLNTISITHRKKVLKNCDKVFYFQNGQISKITHKQPLETNPLSENQNNLMENSHYQSTVYESLEPTSATIIPSQTILQEKQNQGDKQATQALLLKEQVNGSYLWKVLPYMANKKMLILLGIIFPIIQGCIFPTIGLMMAKILVAELQYPLDPNYYKDLIHTYCYVTLGVAIFGGFTNSTSLYIYALLGQDTIKQIRLEVITKILKMPVSWFHHSDRQPEKLTSVMTQSCKTLYNFLKEYTPHLIFVLSSIVSSMIGALAFEWRTGLTSFGLIPLIMLSQAIQLAFIQGMAESKSKIYRDLSQIINESVMNIRTIYSLNCSNTIVDRYNSKLQQVIQTLTKKIFLSGLMYGIAYFLQFVTFGMIFFLSAVFVQNFDITVENSISSMFLIIFAGIAAGNNTNFMPDLSQAQISAKKLFDIKELEDENQLQEKSGSKLLKEPIKGNIQFQNVSFKYENRETTVLDNISFQIREGQHIGIVGVSGCGKSTIFSLLLGFYQPTEGKILIQNIDLSDYDLHHLRASFGLVSQEPFLFNKSIKWNIRYNKTQTSDEQIYEAAKKANFVPESEKKEKLDQKDNEIMIGFEKNVGPKGSHVSGGQKQRIAIARAIIRNPSLLLLDQATSALDPENEAKVQKTLTQIMKGKTTIDITHRLEIIQNSDAIYVIEKGRLEESGTFNELLAKKQIFFRMVKGIGEHTY